MPLYEYHCQPCDARFELLQSASADRDDVRCPRCDGAVERILSTFTTAGGNGYASAGAASCGSGFT